MEATPPVFRAELVHSSVFIAPGAVVIGDVAIAADSSVWFSAVIRGDCAPIRIGRGSNIQDAAVLHADPGFPTTIGDGVTVGHGAIVHGATIEDNVVVGMKSVVQNGARVGANSIIAVGCVIPEGVQIPPGSLVMGLPGKIKRPLEPHEVEMNGYSAQHYVENGKHFAQAGQLLRGTASGA